MHVLDGDLLDSSFDFSMHNERKIANLSEMELVIAKVVVKDFEAALIVGEGLEEALSLEAKLAILLAFGFSGMAALSYEVLWTRVLILILDNTIYAFSIILFTFLIGIAGGSFLFTKIPFNPPLLKGERGGLNREKIITLFAIFQILIGLMGFLSLLLFANYNYLSSGLNTFISWIVQSVGMGYWWGKILKIWFLPLTY